MPIVKVGSNSTGTSGSSLSITHGISIQADDFIIMSCHGNGSPSFNEAGATVGLFTKELADDSASSSRYSLFTRVAGASELATFDIDATASNCTLIIDVYRGVDPSDPYDLSIILADVSEGNGSLASANGIVLSNPGSLGIIWAYSDSSSVSYSNPTNGYGDLFGVSANRTQYRVTKLHTSSGNTGSVDIDLSASDDWKTLHFALNELPSAASEQTLGKVNEDSILVDTFSLSKERTQGKIDHNELLNPVESVKPSTLGLITDNSLINELAKSKEFIAGNYLSNESINSLSYTKDYILLNVNILENINELDLMVSTTLAKVLENYTLNALSSLAGGSLGKITLEEVLKEIVSNTGFELGKLSEESSISTVSSDTGIYLGKLVDISSISVIASKKSANLLKVSEISSIKKLIVPRYIDWVFVKVMYPYSRINEGNTYPIKSIAANLMYQDYSLGTVNDLEVLSRIKRELIKE